jgi:hypothetical protein
MVILVYFIGGCFMDSLALVMLTVPVFFPLITGLGFRSHLVRGDDRHGYRDGGHHSTGWHQCLRGLRRQSWFARWSHTSWRPSSKGIGPFMLSVLVGDHPVRHLSATSSPILPSKMY